jgi:hypothetical protein
MTAAAVAELLSPELVLVSPPDVAARARLLLPDPPAPAPRPSAPGRIELAAVYATTLALTLGPLALLVLGEATPHRP